MPLYKLLMYIIVLFWLFSIWLTKNNTDALIGFCLVHITIHLDFIYSKLENKEFQNETQRDRKTD